MFGRWSFLAVVGLYAATGLAGCAGGGNSAPQPAAVVSPAQGAAESREARSGSSVDVRVGSAAVTAAIPFAGAVRGTITLHAATSGASVRIGGNAGAASSPTTAGWSGSCPPVPPIGITNPFPFPITVSIDRFQVWLPCSVNGKLFGASVYQSNPVPSPLVSTKLGDAAGSGDTITFTPTLTQLTFPPQTTLTISILPETSTAFTQLPAIPNTATVLTSNAASVPNSLALAFPNVQGGTTFQSACYLPGDPKGPGLGGIHVLGTPSFYCVLVPGQTGTSTTFGGASSGNPVTFTLGPNAKPDASLIALDGPPIFAPCAPAGTGQVCKSPSFAIPVYSKAYVSNDADISACVPVSQNADCNGVAGPKAPSATSVWVGQEFQLLFADDPTYNAANTFGGVTLAIGGSRPACAIVVGPDNNGDAPPGYSDPGTPSGATPSLADFIGVGPYVEFDIQARESGTCTIELTEDTGLKRSDAFAITVK